jgi:hypothetical protein
MNVKGKLLKKFDTQKVGATFQKREFVVLLEEDPTYPQSIKLEFVQDKCTLLDDVKIGQTIDVEFNLRGREWTNQQGVTGYFNTLQAWKIDKGAQGATQGTNTAQPATSDDLPF